MMQLKPVEDQVEEQVVALIGASSGICRETALRFAREGGDGAATVATLSRRRGGRERDCHRAWVSALPGPANPRLPLIFDRY
jgi:NAD(P)-dependent dehydrogenase (short-subunit alcohol dehydrogenase family)